MTHLTGIAAQIEQAIGRDLTDRLLRERGGCEINIPDKARGSRLAGIIGDEATKALIYEIGPGRYVLPVSHMRGTGGRKRRAIAMLREGRSNREVALACDLHTRTVTNYRAELAAGDAEDDQLPLLFED